MQAWFNVSKNIFDSFEKVFSINHIDELPINNKK